MSHNEGDFLHVSARSPDTALNPKPLTEWEVPTQPEHIYTHARQSPVAVFGDHGTKVRLKSFEVMNKKMLEAEDGTNSSRCGFFHGNDTLWIAHTRVPIM